MQLELCTLPREADLLAARLFYARRSRFLGRVLMSLIDLRKHVTGLGGSTEERHKEGRKEDQQQQDEEERVR